MLSLTRWRSLWRPLDAQLGPFFAVPLRLQAFRLSADLTDRHGVALEAMLLKPNMALPGLDAQIPTKEEERGA